MEDKKEFKIICDKYNIVFNYEIHKPFYVLTQILESNLDINETILYNNYFKKSLFNNNCWL